MENLSLSLNAAAAVLAAHPLRDVPSPQITVFHRSSKSRRSFAWSLKLPRSTGAMATAPTVVPAAALAPAAALPTSGIPVYFGPTTPTASGPWLWIDSGTYDFILETG